MVGWPQDALTLAHIIFHDIPCWNVQCTIVHLQIPLLCLVQATNLMGTVQVPSSKKVSWNDCQIVPLGGYPRIQVPPSKKSCCFRKSMNMSEMNWNYIRHIWLVVSNNFYFFHSVGNFIIPTDFHSIIFQRGRLKPPTRLWLTIISHIS